MAGLGIGLGSFLQGFAGGMNMAHNYKRMKAWDEEQADKQAVRDQAKQAMANARTAWENEVDAALTVGADANGGQTWSYNGQTFTNRDEARRAASQHIGTVMDVYLRDHAPAVAQAMLERGDVEGATRFQNFLSSEQGKAGLRRWAGMVRAAQLGNPEAFGRHFQAAYNAYEPDGMRVTGTRVLRDGDNITGMEVTFQPRGGGDPVTQRFNGIDQVYRLGIGLAAPENQLQYATQMLKSAEQQRAELAREARTEDRADRRVLLQHDLAERRARAADQRSQAREDRAFQRQLERDAHQSALREAEARGRRTDEPTASQVRSSLQTIIRDKAASDPRFARLPMEEQLAIAEQIYRAQRQTAEQVSGSGSRPQPRGLPSLY